jgi:hypothetical protein
VVAPTAIAEAVERSLEKLKAPRPALADRVSRAAENILVIHFSFRRRITSYASGLESLRS